MASVILDGAVIGKQSIIGAKALVTQGTKIPPGSLVLGTPAKVVRKLTKEERAGQQNGGGGGSNPDLRRTVMMLPWRSPVHKCACQQGKDTVSTIYGETTC